VGACLACFGVGAALRLEMFFFFFFFFFLTQPLFQTFSRPLVFQNQLAPL
jgi:hypothetical protein